jgi:D-lactate dehydrogenase
VEYQGATGGAATRSPRGRGVLAASRSPGRARSPPTRARAALWHIRKGLYAAVAGRRPSGTTALLEDIVVPVPRCCPPASG